MNRNSHALGPSLYRNSGPEGHETLFPIRRHYAGLLPCLALHLGDLEFIEAATPRSEPSLSWLTRTRRNEPKPPAGAIPA